MATKRTGLGRGIGALIPTQSSSEESSRPVDVFFPDNKAVPSTEAVSVDSKDKNADLVDIPGARFVEISLGDIVPNAVQPRHVFDDEALTELVHSVREFGVLQPIVVRPLRDAPGKFELIMGERRFRASKIAETGTIPALIKDTADEDMLRDALLENLHRADLNALEEASAYQQLLSDFGITQEQLAQRIGRSRPQISNTLRLLRLPSPIQRRVAAGVLSAGHARAILSLSDESEMQRLADKIVNEDLSVRAAEAAATQVNAASQAPKKPLRPVAGARHEQLDELAVRLGDRLDTKVKVALTARKGQIKIDFATIGDLNRILKELGENGFGDA
ncbi:MAG: ParB/RepB/Spo0J family partition protein [Mycetocola sp.]